MQICPYSTIKQSLLNVNTLDAYFKKMRTYAAA